MDPCLLDLAHGIKVKVLELLDLLEAGIIPQVVLTVSAHQKALHS